MAGHWSIFSKTNHGGLFHNIRSDICFHLSQKFYRHLPVSLSVIGSCPSSRVGCRSYLPIHIHPIGGRAVSFEAALFHLNILFGGCIIK